MTMAVSKARRGGRHRGHLRLDRQHLGLGRRLRRARRPDRRGRHPRGQDRRRQARPGAGPRRPRAGPRRQLRRRPDGRARAGGAPPDRPGQLAQRVPHRRPAHRRPSRSATTLGDAPDVLCIPVGNAGNVSAYWLGFQAYREAERSRSLPRLYGFQAAGAAPLVDGAPVAPARDRRHRHPHRQPGARGAGAGGDERVGRRRGRGHRLRDPRGLPHAGGRGGHLLRAGLGGLGRRADRSAPRRATSAAGETVVCVLTGHGLKDPDTAIVNSEAVRRLPADLGARRGGRLCLSPRPSPSARRPPRRTSARASTAWPWRSTWATRSSSRAAPGPLEVRVTGEGAGELAEDASNLVCRALASGLGSLDGLAVECRNRIPLGRGLGLVGGRGLRRARRRQRARRPALDARRAAGPREPSFEGHADNAAACLDGGHGGRGARARSPRRVPRARAELAFVAVIPEARTSTEEARRALPAPVPLADAAAHPRQRRRPGARAGRAAAWTTCPACWSDRLHEPHRAASVPAIETLRGAGGRRAGCLGATISGSGPIDAALVPGRRAPTPWPPRPRRRSPPPARRARARPSRVSAAGVRARWTGGAPTCASRARWGERSVGRWRHARGDARLLARAAGRHRQRQRRLVQRRRRQRRHRAPRWPTACAWPRRAPTWSRWAASRCASRSRPRSRWRSRGSCRSIERLAGELDVPVAVDTFKPPVAAAAIAAGAAILNDPTGLRDPEMAPVAAGGGVGVVLRTSSGRPRCARPRFPDVDVPGRRGRWARERLAWAAAAGIPAERHGHRPRRRPRQVAAPGPRPAAPHRRDRGRGGPAGARADLQQEGARRDHRGGGRRPPGRARRRRSSGAGRVAPRSSGCTTSGSCARRWRSPRRS